MLRLLGLAALIAAAWAVWRRKARFVGPRVSRPRTRIVIGGTATEPRITQPTPDLVATYGEHVFWDITNDSGAPQEICLKKFVRKGAPAKERPLEKEDHQRCRTVEATGEIKDMIRPRGSAEKGIYKYSIFLNGNEAVDPDIEIYD